MNELAFARISPRDRIDTRRAVVERAGARSVDVWGCSLRGEAGEVAAWHDTLADSERERAARLVRNDDRDRYVIAHGIVRWVLAGYCGVAPRDLRFDRSPDGKPFLTSGSEPRICFNLSHAGDAALIAVGEAVDIGVDLERERNDIDVTGVAARFFHERERAAIADAPMPARAFLRHWVAKEAVLKAHGSAFALPLDAFAIDFGAGMDAALVVAPSLHELARGQWRVHMLKPPCGWQAAVCLPRDFGVRIRTPAVHKTAG